MSGKSLSLAVLSGSGEIMVEEAGGASAMWWLPWKRCRPRRRESERGRRSSDVSATRAQVQARTRGGFHGEPVVVSMALMEAREQRNGARVGYCKTR